MKVSVNVYNYEDLLSIQTLYKWAYMKHELHVEAKKILRGEGGNATYMSECGLWEYKGSRLYYMKCSMYQN